MGTYGIRQAYCIYIIQTIQMEAFQNIQLSFKCPKALDELQPCQSNWYCDGCRKMVYDFRGMEEGQILDAFNKSGTPLCGIYDAPRMKLEALKLKTPRWATAALFVFGITAMSEWGCGRARTTLGERMAATVKDTVKQLHMVGMLLPPPPEPQFKEGYVGFSKYVHKHVKYNGKYHDRIYVQFMVEKNGTLTDVKILKGGEDELNKSIINVIKRSPVWKPAIKDGKPFRAKYTMPLAFKADK